MRPRRGILAAFIIWPVFGVANPFGVHRELVWFDPHSGQRAVTFDILSMSATVSVRRTLLAGPHRARLILTKVFSPPTGLTVVRVSDDQRSWWAEFCEISGFRLPSISAAASVVQVDEAWRKEARPLELRFGGSWGRTARAQTNTWSDDSRDQLRAEFVRSGAAAAARASINPDVAAALALAPALERSREYVDPLTAYSDVLGMLDAAVRSGPSVPPTRPRPWEVVKVGGHAPILWRRGILPRGEQESGLVAQFRSLLSNPLAGAMPPRLDTCSVE